MENIFENAYYGKPYKAKNGIKAFYHRVFGKIVYCMLEDCRELVPYTLDGKCQGDDYHDIVSEWTEETDEEELKEKAAKSWNFLRSLCSAKSVENSLNNYVTGYINGYKIAKQENQ